MSGESYWAPSGKKIGSTVKSGTKTNVYGPRGERLGTTDKTGTFDVSSRRIANLPLPGLLMARSVRKPRN
jgi:hypothetical protein